MEGYPVLMFIFAGCLFLYAGLLYGTKDVRLIPRSYAVQIKDKRRHAENVAKMIALAALSPLASALVARLTDAPVPSLLVLAGGFILMIWLGARLVKRD